MDKFFNFSFHNPSGFLVAFIPALINLCVIVYIILRLPKNRIVNLFGLFVLSLTLWQISDVLSRLSITEKTADLWENILSPSWIFVGAICLNFTLLYIGEFRIAYSRALYFILYMPAIVFVELYMVNFYPHNFTYSTFWGWVNYHNTSALDQIQIYWIACEVITATILLFRHVFKLRNTKNIVYKQALIIALGIAIPALAGIVSQLILPLVFHQAAIPITSLFMSFFSLATVISLSKYKLFTLSELINPDQLLENMPVMVISISPQLEITYINKNSAAELEIESIDKKDFKWKDLFIGVDDMNKKNFIDSVKKALNGERIINVEFMLSTSLKKQLDFISSFLPIYNNNNIQGVLMVARNISDLKKSYALVSQSQQLLAEAQQISRIGSWDWDITSNTVRWSDELYRIFGYTPAAFEPSYEKFMEVVHPLDRQMSSDIVTSTLSNNQPFDFYHRCIRPDGKIVIVNSKGKTTLDKNNNAIRLSGTGQDVTEKIKQEELLKAQNEELKKTNAELDRFVYSASHDMRAPLTSLFGLILIAEENAENANATLKECLKMMQATVTKLDNFIRDILYYSRNARAEVEHDTIDFEALIKNSCGQMKYMENVLSYKTNVHIHQTGKFISDEKRLSIVFDNLISNAIKYRDVLKENPCVDIDVETDQTHARIIVEDNGIGIAS